MRLDRAGIILVFLTSSCTQQGQHDTVSSPGSESLGLDRLPTGVRLDPVGSISDVGSLPLSMIPSPDGKHFVLILSGYNQQGAQVVERATGKVVQTLAQPAAFVGGAFSRDGRELFVSGGDRDVVYVYGWESDSVNKSWLNDSIVLSPVAPRGHGKRYPAGMAVSPDGKTLYVAENLADSLAVIDLGQGKILKRLPTGRYPYDVTVAPNGTVYVSQWGGYNVSVFQPTLDGLKADGEIPAGRHPSSLLLNKDGSRLFVASGSTDRVHVIDTRKRVIVARLLDPPPAGPGEGATPNAFALSDDGTRLFVAEADANAIAVFDLSRESSNLASAKGDDRLQGRIPTGWFPTAVAASHDSLFIINGKGTGSVANPGGPQPGVARDREGAPLSRQYVYRLMHATLQIASVANAGKEELARFSARVTAANGWDKSTVGRPPYPPFKHVIYIIKENRTYDQIFGDMKQGDGDTSLTFFPRAVGPNHHALADRFGLFDRFFVNAEVSADGHNWSMAAYATDYLQKTVQANYSSRGRSYDFEGTNREQVPDDDASEPANGFLWNLAEKKGITFRNYGNWVVEDKDWAEHRDEGPYQGNKPYLRTHTNQLYPTYDLKIRDQKRADMWLLDLADFTRRKEMPALQLIWLPNDHTSGARAGAPTPRAHFADNDLALGRIIEGLSRSPFWSSTVVFVLEDDAQNGPDHVDSHRSPLLVISPYNKPGPIHRFANTTDVLRTIEEILDLESLSQFDYYGRPLRDIWAASPNTAPYSVLTPSVSLDETNPAATPEARQSETLDLDQADQANDELFNRVLWAVVKGRTNPYPGSRRIAPLELKR